MALRGAGRQQRGVCVSKLAASRLGRSNEPPGCRGGALGAALVWEGAKLTMRGACPPNELRFMLSQIKQQVFLSGQNGNVERVSTVLFN